jgi:hypothetical protein
LLTRGHLIGEIVDDLAAIAAQARQRAKLHLFDLHTYVEDFVCEVLNRTFRLNLRNLNAGVLNHPGLDLGDDTKRWAFQVTADKSGAKVKETLEKITKEDRALYENIRVMVIGSKQGSYTFTGPPFDDFGFTPEMVLDFDDVCARLMSLELPELVDLARYIRSESQRVRVELEIPDENGLTESSIDAYVEALPKPTLSDTLKMMAHFEEDDWGFDSDDGAANIKELSDALARLPRQTREVFRLMVQRRETGGSSHDRYKIYDAALRRIYLRDDLDGDLQLLQQAGLIDWTDWNDGKPGYWELHIPGWGTNFHQSFVTYAEAKGINLNKPLVALDFSDF